MPVEPSMPLLISVSDAFASVLHSFASLPQKPRGPEADVIFKKGLKLMADLYASPMGTCVLQNTTVPVRPTEEYGRVFVCGLGRIPRWGEGGHREHALSIWCSRRF